MNIPRMPVQAALAAYLEDNAAGAEHEEAMRAALEAAFPHLERSCHYISDVDDYCPQHGRDS